MIFILFVSRAHILAAMQPKFCTDTTFMFPELPIKFESNRITLTLSKWWLSLKVIKWSFVDDWVIVLDSNFLGSSGNIKVVPVQNLGSIAASIWAPEAKRMTIIFTPDELCTVSFMIFSPIGLLKQNIIVLLPASIYSFLFDAWVWVSVSGTQIMLRSGVTFYLASHFPSPFSSVLGRTSLGRDSRQNERANLSLCLDKREKISMALKLAYVHI